MSREDLKSLTFEEGRALKLAREQLDAAKRWSALTGEGLDRVQAATAHERSCYSRWLAAAEAWTR